MNGFRPNNGSASTSQLHQSEGSQERPTQSSRQRTSCSKNKTHQSAVMKIGDVTIADSSPDLLKTIRPLPGQENRTQIPQNQMTPWTKWISQT